MDKEYLKRVGIRILTALFSIGFLVYIGYHFFNSFTSEVETIPTQKASITMSVSSTGYLFRQEMPVFYSASGAYTSSVVDGEKVGLYDEIAAVYSSVDPDLVARIRELSDQIDFLSESKTDGTLSLADTRSVDSRLFAIIKEIRQKVEKGDYYGAASLRSDFLGKLSKRNLITTNASDFIDQQISSLSAERKNLVARLGSKLESVTAARSGYYYSECDGYEDIFLPDLLPDLTVRSFEELIGTDPDPYRGKKTVGKIVTDYLWYLVCELDQKTLSEMADLSECKISFPYNGDKELTLDVMRIEAKRGEENGLLILSCGSILPSFNFTRSQPIEITETEYSGYKVPVSAARMVDGKLGVYVLEETTVVFKKISVITREDDYYLVEMHPEEEADAYDFIELNDSIIVSGKGLYHGKVLS